MNSRRWILVGVFAALGISYITFFTEWLRPAPIEIASQVRFSVQPPRFGRPVKMTNLLQLLRSVDKLVSNAPPPKIVPVPPDPLERIGRPEKGAIDQAPGGVANVTFSLDNWYSLTRIRVEDVPVDGTAPRIVWQIAGKSRPANSLLYGRNPEGMKPLVPGATAEPLQAGVPYRLILEAGRRRGTANFKTTPVPPG